MSTKPADVSVLMAVRDQKPEWLVESVESVMAQEGPIVELVLVDDGSKDEACLRALDELYDKHVNLELLHRPADGAGAARAFGLINCTAELVALLGSDDIMPPNRLAVQHALMVEDPTIDVLAGQLVYMAPDKTWLCDSQLEYDASKPYDGQKWCIADPTVMYRRAAVMDAGSYDHWRVHASDHYLWIAMAKNGARFEVTPAKWALYRVHPGQVTFPRSKFARELYRRWEVGREARPTASDG